MTLDMAISALSAEQSDLISRADAIEAIENAYCKPCKERGDDYNEVRCRACSFDDAIIQIDALPSAEAVKVAYICDGRKCDSDCSECFRTLDIEHARDFKLMGDTYFQQEAEAEPTVIRSKTLMPTKDFKEWAKRVKEENGEDVIVIPCDAELADRPTIVRCKDCKYGHKTTPVDSGADILCDFCDWEYFDDDYCSRGERREE